MTLEVGSKTFLLGEYAALNGSAGLFLNTAPRFQLVEGGPQLSKMPAGGSPVANLLERIGQSGAKFMDPHNGAGGLGASSAEFLLQYALKFEPEFRLNKNELSDAWLVNAWSMFRECSKTSEGQPPSGLDVLSQALGGIAYVDPHAQKFSNLLWRFSEVDFLIVRTGIKVATHEHLKSVKDISSEMQRVLEKTVHAGLHAFEQNVSDDLATAVAEYGHYLDELKCVHPRTQGILGALREVHEVKAAKGCGALGADTVVVLVARNGRELVKKFVTDEMRLEILASSADLTNGLTVRKYVT